MKAIVFTKQQKKKLFFFKKLQAKWQYKAIKSAKSVDFDFFEILTENINELPILKFNQLCKDFAEKIAMKQSNFLELFEKNQIRDFSKFYNAIKTLHKINNKILHGKCCESFIKIDLIANKRTFINGASYVWVPFLKEII